MNNQTPNMRIGIPLSLPTRHQIGTQLTPLEQKMARDILKKIITPENADRFRIEVSGELIDSFKHIKHVKEILNSNFHSHADRTRAAERIYDELVKVSITAARNFAARAYDALHGHDKTGSHPYPVTADKGWTHPAPESEPT